MKIDDMTTQDLQELVRTVSARVTRVILTEREEIGELNSTRVLIIEPLAPADD